MNYMQVCGIGKEKHGTLLAPAALLLSINRITAVKAGRKLRVGHRVSPRIVVQAASALQCLRPIQIFYMPHWTIKITGPILQLKGKIRPGTEYRILKTLLKKNFLH